jgi:hypothetical protein
MSVNNRPRRWHSRGIKIYNDENLPDVARWQTPTEAKEHGQMLLGYS